MTLYDHTPAFLTFYEATRNKTDAEKLEHFWRDLHPVYPAFYNLVLKRWEMIGESVDQKLLDEFRTFESYRDNFVKRQVEVPRQLEEAILSFKQTFPDFSTDFGVTLLHSLEEMDGGTRKLDGKHTFIFGLDVMARHHNWQNETAFFHHELLHFYLKQLHAATDWYDGESLLLSLWEEGLAVYVSHLLNPDATYAELSLDLPYGMSEQVWAQRVQLVEDLLPHLLSEDEATNRLYFTGLSLERDVPGRAGYFLGFIVVNELAKTRPLSELLAPESKARLLKLVKGQLESLVLLPKDAYFPNPPGVDT